MSPPWKHRHRFRGPPGGPPHGPGPWGRRPHRGRLRLALGIHQRVRGFLFVALVLGAGVGWQLHAGNHQGLGPFGIALLIGLVLCIWPLAWIATFRLARPVSELAQIAGALRDGQLTRREELDAGDDELGEVAGALHTMADRVSQQLADQRALLAAVSHELRSPLARVRVMVELAREGRAPDGMHDELQAEIDGMDALVGDLLAGARIDFEALDPQPVQAAVLVQRALELVEVPSEALQVEPVEVRADVTLSTRALRGVLDNAVRHGGRVERVSVTVAGDWVRFSVDDDGPGFAEGEEEQVFQPFWRRPPQAGQAAEPGTGLGLALVRQIARAHGGEAGATNREPRGATVWLELPRA